MDETEPTPWTCAYEPRPESAGQVRDLLRQAMAEWDLADPDRLAAVVLSEAVSNAVRTAQPFAVALRKVSVEGRPGVYIEVFDALRTVPPEPAGSPADVDVEEEHGRGLPLIDELSDKHEWIRAGSGKVLAMWVHLAPARQD
jgi:anti-sigma regulatory factor (Ser/Thr protein kinase)